jgi:hypothetical protein
LFIPRGYGNIFIQRRNPDLDYTWFIDAMRPYDDPHRAEHNIRAFLDFGLSGLYFLTPNLTVSGSFVFRDEHNPLNQASVRRYNFHFSTLVRYTF